MDNLKEFKAFLKTIPSIKEDVLNHRYTWQEIYEIYTMYGEDDHFFKPYKEHPIENMNAQFGSVIRYCNALMGSGPRSTT